MSPREAFGIFFILIGCAVPIIVVGVVYYLKKRFEHKQIMTAIEKGTPLSELKPPKQNGALWIKNLTIGIALITIGLSFWFWGPGPSRGGVSSFVAFILFGIGVAWVVRALLNRKYQPQNQPLAKSNAVENKSSLGASTSETLQQSNE